MTTSPMSGLVHDETPPRRPLRSISPTELNVERRFEARRRELVAAGEVFPHGVRMVTLDQVAIGWDLPPRVAVRELYKMERRGHGHVTLVGHEVRFRAVTAAEALVERLRDLADADPNDPATFDPAWDRVVMAMADQAEAAAADEGRRTS